MNITRLKIRCFGSLFFISFLFFLFSGGPIFARTYNKQPERNLKSPIYPSQKIPLEMHWTHSNLKIESVISEYLDDDFCSESLRSFKACYIALDTINYVAQYEYFHTDFPSEQAFPQKFDWRLIPTKIYNSLGSELGEVVLLAPPFTLVSIKDNSYFKEVEFESKPKPIIRKNYEQIKEMRKRIDSELEILYSSYYKGEDHIDFKNIFLSLLRKFKINKKFNSMLAGDILTNMYSKIYSDPHLFFEPITLSVENYSFEKQTSLGLGILMSRDSHGQIKILEVEKDSFEFTSPLQVQPNPQPQFKSQTQFQPNDIILSIEGKKVNGMSLESISKFISINRKVGQKLHLEISRNGILLPLYASIKKTENSVIESRIISFYGSNFGYIKVVDFIPSSFCTLMKNEMSLLIKLSISGWILDLRDNPGGQIENASCLGNYFLGPKKVYTVKDLKAEKEINLEKDQALQNPPLTKLPLVVLINENSASASEIVAGSLQDYKRAWIVGKQSFGKGSIQSLFPLGNGLAFYKTTELFFLPSGRTSQIGGIVPDFEVPSDMIQTKNEAPSEQLVYWREQDISSDVIFPKVNVDVPKRAQEIQIINECVEAFDQKNAGRVQFNSSINNESDHQFLAAKKILKCII